MTNRVVMMNNTLRALREVLKIPFEADLEAVNCHHNYISANTITIKTCS